MDERAPLLFTPRRVLILGMLLGGACAAPPPQGGTPVVRGPLEVRVQHPLALTLLGPRPRRAAPSGAGSWRVGWQSAYSSIYEENMRGGQRAVFDGEFWTNSLLVRYGLGQHTDLELELGTLYTTSGFLDGFADSFHEALSLPDGGRDEAPKDQYLIGLALQDQVLYELEEDRLGLLDVPLWIVHAVRIEDEQGPGVALRAGVELPFGSESRGFGNGTLDWGAGVLFERSQGRFTWSGGADLVITGESSSFEEAGVEIEEIVQLALGGEYRVTTSTSLLVQLLWHSPLVKDFDLEEINREILDLGLGFAMDLGAGTRVYGAFHEDLVAATGSDFTFLLGFFWGV